MDVSLPLPLSRLVRALGTESALEILSRAKRLEAAGREIVHLEVGEPSFPTPEHVVEAGVRALRDGHTRYAPPAGLSELRGAIADSMRARGIAAEPDQVIVTPGSKLMLYYALTTLVGPGDEVLVPDPGFPIYGSVAAFAGGTPVGYLVSPSRPTGLDVEEIARRITPRSRVLVLNSPHNPTGTAVDAPTIAALAELVLRHDLAVCSDEIYGQLVFEGEHRSIAAVPGLAERSVVVDGFSKTYSMTGWRLGYGVMPASLARLMERFVINTVSCAPPFVQLAALAALEGPQDCVAARREELMARRDLFVAGLNRLYGYRCPTPRGAFYAFPSVEALLEEHRLPGEGFAEALLDELGLACVAGTTFGPCGAGHIRLSFAAPTASLRRGLELLGAMTHPVAVPGRPRRAAKPLAPRPA